MHYRRLNSLGIAASGIEEKKLVRHMEYCSDLAIKADSFYETATMEAEVAEKKLDSQRLALDAQKLNAQVADAPERRGKCRWGWGKRARKGGREGFRGQPPLQRPNPPSSFPCSHVFSASPPALFANRKMFRLPVSIWFTLVCTFCGCQDFPAPEGSCGVCQVAKEKQRLKEQREAEERERLALERLDKIKRLQEEWQQGKELMQVRALPPRLTCIEGLAQEGSLPPAHVGGRPPFRVTLSGVPGCRPCRKSRKDFDAQPAKRTIAGIIAAPRALLSPPCALPPPHPALFCCVSSRSVRRSLRRSARRSRIPASQRWMSWSAEQPLSPPRRSSLLTT